MDVVDDDMITHSIAFRFGSVEPDLVPTFITTKHRIDLTFGRVEKKIRHILDNYNSNKGLTVGLTADLGIVTHYVADYFTFPHNREYPGDLREHFIYETELMGSFKNFVKKLEEAQVRFQERNLQNVEDICSFIQSCHDEYLKAVKTIQNDCEYIVEICAEVVAAILNILQQKNADCGCAVS